MEGIFSYSFPAIRGIQAQREYYVVMCPLKLISRIFLFDEEEIPPEYRAQRLLNKSRVPEISSYILDNPSDYVFSSLTASIDGEMKFKAYAQSENFQNIGTLNINLDARFLINDGQHRRAAIEEALRLNPELGDETISVVFFQDKGLVRSQQMFADLNRHAVNTTSSLGILYDHRDQLANLSKKVINHIPFLERYTDRQKQSLSKLSPKLFSLSNIFQTNSRLLNKKKGEFITEDEEKFVMEFWTNLTEVMLEWNMVQERKISPAEIRMNYISTQGVCLEALGVIGNYLYVHHPENWTSYIKRLRDIDWNRSNRDWLGRAYSSTGRINKNNETIRLTANKIKVKIGLSLTEEDLLFENKKIGD
ncbi:DNA sulfur modification protein DndB [Paenibacillus sp. FSL W7-1287]|uniref:DNA sulfur modification protein DndB n=1 Tax=Paenibacillus sp. FSL W7-1287 TaxID=2954538 RepID=UPI0030F971CB